MKRAFFTITFVVLPLIGIIGAASPACLAWDGSTTCSSSCSSHDSRCCRYCDAICNFRLIDGCTHCAWRRTWYGPNALATPLRQYYIPRPPECSECNGYAGGYVLGSYPAEHIMMSSEITPEAAAGFSPFRFERLGEIRNELDLAGVIATPNRSSAPAR